MRKRIAVVAVLVLSMLAVMVPLTGSAGATGVGNEGCSPGYWKNHPESWQEYTPESLLKALGSPTKPGWKFHPDIAMYGDYTLMEALNAQGGPGLDGAAQILIRAGAAAWLNAAHDGVLYPYRRFGTGLDGRTALITLMNNALTSGSRYTMLRLYEKLDYANNLYCPL
jgi:hypothetical protein